MIKHPINYINYSYWNILLKLVLYGYTFKIEILLNFVANKCNLEERITLIHV